MSPKPIAITLTAAALLAACGKDEDPGTNTTDQPLQCTSQSYVAFDALNHQPQDQRLAAYVQMADLMGAAVDNPALAATNFAMAEQLYKNTAELQVKVQGRTDDHLAAKPNVGMELDRQIVDAFARGKNATTALALDIATETVEKSLLHFFFLSVYHEMAEGTRGTWDEAFGYFGSPADGKEEGRKGLASLATSRDAANGTNLTAEILSGLIDGSCTLTKALTAASKEQIDPRSVTELAATIDSVDLKLQKVLAYYVGHELLEIDELKPMAAADADARDEIGVKRIEGDLLFRPLERLMNAKGGESQARAGRIRAKLDAGANDRTGAWITTFDARSIVNELQTEYGIAIRG